MEQLPITTENALIAAAWKGAANAYIPYSHFPVGAAVLGEDGNIYTGCNVENISFGLTNCAERTAIFTMVAAGCKKFTAIAVTVNTPKITPPCGACRQVIAEMATGGDVPVILTNGETVIRETVNSMLPYAYFTLETNG